MKSKKYLIFLLLFSILFWLVVFFSYKTSIKGKEFFDMVIGTDIWKYILIGIIISIFGKKYIDSLK